MEEPRAAVPVKCQEPGRERKRLGQRDAAGGSTRRGLRGVRSDTITTHGRSRRANS